MKPVPPVPTVDTVNTNDTTDSSATVNATPPQGTPSFAAPVTSAVTPASTSASTTAFSPNYATELVGLRRWQKSELAIYVEQPVSGMKPEQSDYLTSIAQGIALWKPYLQNIVAVRFVQTPADADIQISLVDHGTLPCGAIGHTQVSYRNRDNVITGAVVRLDKTLSPNLMTQVSAHEFGHALGLEGHSGQKGDLMYTHAHLPSVITQRDANTVHLNYALQAPHIDSQPIEHAPVASFVAPSAITSSTSRSDKSRSDIRTVTACALPQ